MKTTEFKKIIREEVRKIIKEEDFMISPGIYVANVKHIAPVVPQVQQVITTLETLNKKIEQTGPLSEDIVDAIESLKKLIDSVELQTK